MALNGGTLSDFFKFDLSSTDVTFRENLFEDWANSITDKDGSALTKIDAWAKTVQEVIMSGGLVIDITKQADGNYIGTTDKITAYEEGMKLVLRPDVANDGAVTVNINSLGAIPLKKDASGTLVDLVAGDIVANREYSFRYSNGNLVWSDASQVSITGDVDNLVAISNAGGLEDSGINKGTVVLFSGTSGGIIPPLDDGSYTKAEINALLNSKANLNDVYTTTQIDEMLANLPTDENMYTKEEVDNLVNKKADSTVVNNIQNTITNIQSDVEDLKNGGGVSIKIQPITQEEYDALTDEQKEDMTVLYAIY